MSTFEIVLVGGLCQYVKAHYWKEQNGIIHFHVGSTILSITYFSRNVCSIRELSWKEERELSWQGVI